jgi:hypothetical protein
MFGVCGGIRMIQPVQTAKPEPVRFRPKLTTE